MIHDFFIQDITFFFIYLIIVLSLNLAVGFTGMVNLGHMVFVGVGAYVSAILTLGGMQWYFALLLAGIISAALGILMAAVTSRLKGDYFQIVTLGTIFIAIAVSRNWISLTRGALGLPGIPDIIKSNFYYMAFVGTVSVSFVLFFHWLVNSETGKIFQAIRDDETAAAVLGKNTYLYKIFSMTVSTFFAGVAGGLLAHQINFIDPSIFDLEQFIIILFMLIVGGLASIKGTIIGTLLLFIIVDSLRFLVVAPELIGPVRQMSLLVILLVVLIFRPRGIFGRVDV